MHARHLPFGAGTRDRGQRLRAAQRHHSAHTRFSQRQRRRTSPLGGGRAVAHQHINGPGQGAGDEVQRSTQWCEPAGRREDHPDQRS
jgi:hypothetical protein